MSVSHLTATKIQPSVFVSYARSDGMEFAQNLRHRLIHEYQLSVWQDIAGIEAGEETWWSQIERAIKSVEHLVLVMTPGAEQSPTVVKEWRLARQEGVCVFPIIGRAGVDFGRLPHWIRRQHFIDPEIPEQWSLFINKLKRLCLSPRVPFMFGSLPTDLIRRSAEIDSLMKLLLNESRSEPVAITAALRSAGGYGKTVMASVVCTDDDVKNAFGDGVLWVTLGDSISEQDVIGQIENLIYLLSDKRPGFTSIEPAKTRLIELLADREILIVIDDVCHPAHLKPFLQGGPRCARLITTRYEKALPAYSQRINVDAMREDESIALLGWNLEDAVSFRSEIHLLANKLRNWPQLLSMVNGVLRMRVRRGSALADALRFVNRSLDESGLTVFDEDDKDRTRAVGMTIKLSLDQLDEGKCDRFFDLAILPENTDIPTSTLHKHWSQTASLSVTAAERLCDELCDMSLVRNHDLKTKTIRMQDVIQLYLYTELYHQLPTIHERLLEAHAPSTREWADLPEDEPYLWDFLTFHLDGAGRHDEMQRTIKHWQYLAKKIKVRNCLAIVTDLSRGTVAIPDDHVLLRMLRALSNTEYLFNKASATDLEAELFIRLSHLKESLNQMEAPTDLRFPYLSLRFDFPDLQTGTPNADIGNSTQDLYLDSIVSCSSTIPFRSLLSASVGGALRVLDPNGNALLDFDAGHDESVKDCAISPRGDYVVTASFDRTLRLCELSSGSVRVLNGHEGSVNGCAFSPDGSFVASASSDGTVKVWTVDHSEAPRTFERIETTEKVTDENGQFLLDANDHPIEIVIEVLVQGHSDAVNACAFSFDGRSIGSCSADQTIKIWDLSTGTVRSFDGHSASVNRCAFSHDNRLIVSASSDQSLRVWDIQSREPLAELTGHHGPVNDCAFGDGNDLIISASSDGTIRLWKWSTRQCLATFYDQGKMFCCAVNNEMVYAGGTRGLYLLKIVSSLE